MSLPASPNAGVGGYTCGTCGAFVPYNTTHQCPGTRTYPLPQPPTRVDPVISEQQKLAVLTRIADALEKLVDEAAYWHRVATRYADKARQ